jgi:hypothetical protein
MKKNAEAVTIERAEYVALTEKIAELELLV